MAYNHFTCKEKEQMEKKWAGKLELWTPSSSSLTHLSPVLISFSDPDH